MCANAWNVSIIIINWQAVCKGRLLTLSSWRSNTFRPVMVTLRASRSSFCRRCLTPLLTKYRRLGRPGSSDLQHFPFQLKVSGLTSAQLHMYNLAKGSMTCGQDKATSCSHAQDIQSMHFICASGVDKTDLCCKQSCLVMIWSHRGNSGEMP